MTVLPQEPEGEGQPHFPDSLPQFPQGISIPDDLSALFDSPQLPADLSPLDSLDASTSGIDQRGGQAGSGNKGEETTGDVDASDITIPDDISGLTAPGGIELAAVLTPLKDANMLAALCTISDCEVDAFPTDGGVIAAIAGKQLGGKVSPGAGESAAEKLSLLLPGLPIVLVTRADGQLTATRYVSGQAQEQIPPGLLLSSAEDAVVDIFTGQLAPQEAAGLVSSQAFSKEQAQAYLSRFTVKGRRRLFPKRGVHHFGAQSSTQAPAGSVDDALQDES